jgi:hypothetical protein
MKMATSNLSHFAGLNTVDRTITVPVKAPTGWKTAYTLLQAKNVEIDNSYALASRSGYEKGVSGTDIHSLWGDEKFCFYVDGQSLYQYQGRGSTLIRAGLSMGARMSYAPVNDRVYYTNGFQIGCVYNLADISFEDPGIPFKIPLPPGQFIAHYKACLYVASGKLLYIADPLCHYYDARQGYKQFAQDITMLRPVDDGIYVSDDRIWFLKGSSGEDFNRDEVYDVRAIPFTDVRVSGFRIGDGLNGNVAIWTGLSGICLGTNDGKVINITSETYKFTPRGSGSAMLREKNQVNHYINTMY